MNLSHEWRLYANPWPGGGICAYICLHATLPSWHFFEAQRV